MKTIGSIIKNRRTNLKMTQQQLADAVGVSISSVSLWEKGKNEPTTGKIPAIAEALKCDIAELLDFQEEDPLFAHRVTIEELDILELYRALNKDGQMLATEILYKLYESRVLKKPINEITDEEDPDSLLSGE